MPIRRLLLSVAIAASTILLVAVGGSAGTSAQIPGKTVRSADRLVVVTVPPGALTKKTKIAVRVLTRSKWPKEVRRAKGIRGVKLYELKPDGLRFKKPVTITRRFRGLNVSDGLPGMWFVSRSSRGKWELLRNQSVRQQGKDVIASGTTRHFSDVVALDGGARLSLAPSHYDKTVGDSWWPYINIEGTRDPYYGGAILHAAGALEVVVNPMDPRRHDYLSCASEGKGTFTAKAFVSDETPSAGFVQMLALWSGKPWPPLFLSTTLNGTANCRARGAPPPPPPPGAPSCSQSPTATLTTYNGEPQAQVFGECLSYLAAGATHAVLHAPSGKGFAGYSAHTPEPCTFGSGSPWPVSVECRIKADGRICMIVKVQPLPVVADTFRLVFERADNSVLLDQSLPLQASQPACNVGP